MIPAALLAGALVVEVLASHRPAVVEVRRTGGWSAVRATERRRLEVQDAQVRLPGRLQRRYPGRLVILADGQRLRFLNLVEEDDYLAGVLAAEADTDQPAALAALAIAARSMVPFLKGRHVGGVLCDLTHCQAYSGLSEAQSIREAVRTTRGRCLAYRGLPALAPYHSTCGGHTRPPQSFFEQTAPYLQGVDDRGLCARSPHYRWEVWLAPADAARIFGPGRGAPRHFDAAAYRREGRVLGWNRVRSAVFEIETHPGGLLLRGQGLGHGVGLCQWGAAELARRGDSASEILAHYFPGTQIRPCPCR